MCDRRECATLRYPLGTVVRGARHVLLHHVDNTLPLIDDLDGSLERIGHF